VKGREAPGMPVVIGPHIHGYANPDGSGEGNWAMTTNDAAERLLFEICECGLGPNGKRKHRPTWSACPAHGLAKDLDAALADERRATVERIRAAFGKNAQLVSEWTAILDAERDR
jgi:hypothetical protein